MELLALTAGAAMVIVRTKRQKEAELAARERRSMKRRRILWVKKWLLRRAQFGQYDKRKYFGRRKAAVVLRKVAEGLRFTCGQYASFTVFAVSLCFTAFRRFRRILAEKLNMFNFSASTPEPVSTRMSDRLWTGKPSRYVTSQQGRLSLLPSVGR